MQTDYFKNLADGTCIWRSPTAAALDRVDDATLEGYLEALLQCAPNHDWPRVMRPWVPMRKPDKSSALKEQMTVRYIMWLMRLDEAKKAYFRRKPSAGRSRGEAGAACMRAHVPHAQTPRDNTTWAH